MMRPCLPVLAASVLLSAAVARPLAAQPGAAQPPADGAAVFKGQCATCHDGAAGSRAPAPDQLKGRTPESIIAALTGGAMRYQGL